MGLINDIKNDAATGTPGPWLLVETDHGSPLYQMQEWEIKTPADEHSAMMGNTPFYPWQSENMADARRIARVPTTEAALLAGHELALAVLAERGLSRATSEALGRFLKEIE